MIVEKWMPARRDAALEEVLTVYKLMEEDERAGLRFCTAESPPGQ